MNIVEQALAILGTQKAVPLNEGVLLFARLLAWQKISASRKVGEDGCFRQCTTPEASKVFRVLSGQPSLGENAKAFRGTEDALSKISPDTLEQLCNLLSNNPPDHTKLLAALHDALAIASPDSEMHTIPGELVELVTSLAAPGKDERVFCPFDMSVRVAEQAAMDGGQVSVEVQEDTPWPYLASIFLENRLDVRQGHPVTHPAWTGRGKPTQFDVVMAVPPWGQKYLRTEVACSDTTSLMQGLCNESVWVNGDIVHLMCLLQHCSKRLIAVIPPNQLFRDLPDEQEFKRYLLEKGLETVIALPKRILGSNAAFHVLVVNAQQSRQDGVLMVDVSNFIIPRRGRGNPLTGRDKLRDVAEVVRIVQSRQEGQYSRLVKKDEYTANKYNLLPSLYVVSQEKNLAVSTNEKTAKLSEIAEFIRPQMLKSDDTGVELLEAGISDIGENGELSEPKKSIKVKASSLEQAKKQKIQAGDVLLGIRGAVGRVALVPDSCGKNWIAGQAFMILRVKPEVFNPVVLYRYLVSPVGQAELARRVSGGTVPLLQTGTLKEFPVPDVSEAEKTAILLIHEKIQRKYRAIERIRGKIQTLNQEYWPMSK